jgi:hypothetical protein
LPLTLQAIRVLSPGQLQVLSENSVNIIGGSNSFDTRIAVQTGDRIALRGGGALGALVCESGAEEAHLGAFLPTGPGSTTAFEESNDNLRVPLTATIEPDADNDGFGDETQDACPQSAAFQTPCPPVTLSTSTQVKKNSVTVIVTSSTAAPVTVKGVAKLGKGKKAKMNGGTQNLIPGTLNKYRLFFPKGLKNKLKELDPSKKVKLKVNVTGTSVTGAVTKKTLKLKLKGQAKD